MSKRKAKEMEKHEEETSRKDKKSKADKEKEKKMDDSDDEGQKKNTAKATKEKKEKDKAKSKEKEKEKNESKGKESDDEDEKSDKKKKEGSKKVQFEKKTKGSDDEETEEDEPKKKQKESEGETTESEKEADKKKSSAKKKKSPSKKDRPKREAEEIDPAEQNKVFLKRRSLTSEKDKKERKEKRKAEGILSEDEEEDQPKKTKKTDLIDEREPEVEKVVGFDYRDDSEQNWTEIKDHLSKHGWAPFADVPKEAELALAWKYFKEDFALRGSSVNPDDSTTWTDVPYVSSTGKVVGLAQSKSAWYCRSLPGIRAINEKLWGTDKLAVSMSNPFIQLPFRFRAGKPTQKKWQTNQHPDYGVDRPVLYPGFLVLKSNTNETGGIALYPSSHQKKVFKKLKVNLDKSKEKSGKSRHNKTMVQLDPVIGDYVPDLEQPIFLSVNAGTYIVVDSRLIVAPNHPPLELKKLKAENNKLFKEEKKKNSNFKENDGKPFSFSVAMIPITMCPGDWLDDEQPESSTLLPEWKDKKEDKNVHTARQNMVPKYKAGSVYPFKKALVDETKRQISRNVFPATTGNNPVLLTEAQKALLDGMKPGTIWRPPVVTPKATKSPEEAARDERYKELNVAEVKAALVHHGFPAAIIEKTAPGKANQLMLLKTMDMQNPEKASSAYKTPSGKKTEKEEGEKKSSADDDDDDDDEDEDKKKTEKEKEKETEDSEESDTPKQNGDDSNKEAHSDKEKEKEPSSPSEKESDVMKDD